MKKKLLIVYSKMIVGGSTTSLLSLLHELDYSQYDVDLLLFEKGGALDAQIPESVNILENTFLKTARKSLSYVMTFMWSYVNSIIKSNPLMRSQCMSKVLAKSQLVLEKEYDVAIAFLEFWASSYVYQRVKAARKFLWLHCDYKGTGLEPKYDTTMYENVDAVITVSPACRENFKELFPTVKSVRVIQNILSEKTVLNMASAFVPDKALYDADVVFITVARIDFMSKGYDRGVGVFEKMNQYHPDKSFRWIIIGDGPDKLKLEEMIKNAGLEKKIVLLGEMTNPHPFVKKADVFFLPSRYEGKPMAITEAQMNGIVPFVTNYASAQGQIRHMCDGIICDNDDEAIAEMMDRIFSGQINIDVLKKEISRVDYSNRDEIKKLYELIEK